GRKRFVGQAVIEAARRLRQPIRALQARPAVLAAEKLVRETKAQLRMAAQVRDRAHAQPLGVRAAHAKRIAVREAQWKPRREPERREAPVDAIESERFPGLQDLARNRSAVFRINVDPAVFQRLDQDRGVAEPWTVLAARELPQYFAEDVGLGEAL